ncbi:M23 family metallopeptidase [Flaviaesturariibacter amylovorans]|uniref:M23ase beta-sheet core domain-containing protein n=1 Tax=Flaviaesturariibacter amylovorans TaxID=1084520 RepID=A0ABP8HE42_9BACT
MNRILFLVLLTCFLFSCSGKGGAFGGRTPLQRYAQKLIDADLRTTTLGGLWLRAYDSSLQAPEVVSLPYRKAGYFADTEPRAVSIAFAAGRGSGLQIDVTPRSAGDFRLYTELWRQESDGQYRLVHAFDSAQRAYTYTADKEEKLLLRLQPELLQKGEYTLSITVGPSLAFPVPRGRIGSVWGDARDGGARRHEGIDIFAPRRSAIIAIAPGTVGRVETTRRGGKVVWLRPDDRPINLYYAHLEEQLVEAGDRVDIGDTIGLVGTTGNAKGTPPHLHFGIYGRGGAIDPEPYVDPELKRPGLVARSVAGNWMRLRRAIEWNGIEFSPNELLRVTDVDERFAIGYTPGCQKLKVALSNLQNIDNQIVRLSNAAYIPLLDEPSERAAAQQAIAPRGSVYLRGFWRDYALVRQGTLEGWVPRGVLR